MSNGVTLAQGAAWFFTHWHWLQVFLGLSFVNSILFGGMRERREKRIKTQQAHELKLAEMVLRSRSASLPESELEKPKPRRPAPCDHLGRVAPVRTELGDLVAWLCTNPNCMHQFPKNYSIPGEYMRPVEEDD